MSRPSVLGNLAALLSAVVAAALAAGLFLASRPGDPLAALGFEGYASPWCAFGALVPVMLWLELAPSRTSAWAGALGAALLGACVAGLAAYGAACSVLPAMSALGYPDPDAIASARLAAALQASPMVCATLLTWYAVRRGRHAAGLFAFAWVAAEGLSPLGAERLSVALYDHVAWIALASIGGPSLVSLLYALINGALTECLLFALPPHRRPYLVLVAALGVAGSYGVHTLRVDALAAATENAPTVRILVVQPASSADPQLTEQTRAALEARELSDASDASDGDRDTQRRNRERSNEPRVRSVDAIVWPGAPFDPPLAWAELDLAPRLPADAGSPFIVGALMARDDPSTSTHAQVVVLTDADRQRQAFYQATVLAPFIDYAPLEESLPASIRTHIHDAGRRPGQLGAMLELERVPFGVMVGWDDISGPDLRRQLAEQDPEWLLSVVDDRAFAGTPLPVYHRACAVFRAIEQGRYLLRAAAEGGSVLVDPLGRTQAPMPLTGGGAAVFDVPRLHAATGYQVVGNFATLLCLLFTISLVLIRPGRQHSDDADPSESDGVAGA